MKITSIQNFDKATSAGKMPKAVAIPTRIAESTGWQPNWIPTHAPTGDAYRTAAPPSSRPRCRSARQRPRPRSTRHRSPYRRQHIAEPELGTRCEISRPPRRHQPEEGIHEDVDAGSKPDESVGGTPALDLGDEVTQGESKRIDEGARVDGKAADADDPEAGCIRHHLGRHVGAARKQQTSRCLIHKATEARSPQS